MCELPSIFIFFHISFHGSISDFNCDSSNGFEMSLSNVYAVIIVSTID